MRRPIYANSAAPMLAVTVFEAGKRNALFEASGFDPSHIAKTVSEHPLLGDNERTTIRQKVRSALGAIVSNSIENMTDCQLDIGGRRIRIKSVQ